MKPLFSTFRAPRLTPLCAKRLVWALAAATSAITSLPASAQTATSNTIALTDDRFAIFAPSAERVDHTIDYDIWDFALKQLVVDMGPSIRERPPIITINQEIRGTRIRAGHNSRFRTEGSMMAFQLLDKAAIASFTEYREDLQRVANELDVSRIPRNEQLAFWFNLHNVTMVEQIAKNWPFRQPRRLKIDGVLLDEAKLVTIRGVAMSLKDIRERIVYANWRDPRVIYGFWRGEIGSPSLARDAFTGFKADLMLSQEAEYYVNSLRGTEKRGDTLHVSTLYEEVAPFYFPDFANDVRAHIENFATEEVLEFVQKTSEVEASIREWDIADLAGGYRDNIALQKASPTLSSGAIELLGQRAVKLQRIERRRKKGERTGTVTFTPLILPGDDPAASEIK